MIYTTQPANVADLGTAHFYVTAPLVLLGILRYLQLTLVEEKSASPTQLLCSDHFLFAIVVSWVVVSGLLIYQ
ncbi:MAG: Prenyltransferase, UbiA family [uncultured bacterium]|nr:MAG: Prenyltransferase, UbiA family [uncultured bacterium]